MKHDCQSWGTCDSLCKCENLLGLDIQPGKHVLLLLRLFLFSFVCKSMLFCKMYFQSRHTFQPSYKRKKNQLISLYQDLREFISIFLSHDAHLSRIQTSLICMGRSRFQKCLMLIIRTEQRSCSSKEFEEMVGTPKGSN